MIQTSKLIIKTNNKLDNKIFMQKLEPIKTIYKV